MIDDRLIENEKDGTLPALITGETFQAGDDSFPVTPASYYPALHPVHT